MNEIFNDILAKYDTSRPKDRENAIREIIQEGVLYSLSQTDFFDRAAFMGGTDLRILHGLNRFSEDLDFMLRTPDPDFELETYLPTLKDGLRHFGIDFDVSLSEKTKRTSIKEGIVKAHTKELYLKFYSDSEYHEDVYPTQLTRVKIEVDTDPAENAGFENRFKTSPFGYKVTSCDLPTMFSGKIHAILCRPWANRFKGRDLYDFIFYIDKGVRYNRGFLNAKLMRTSSIEKELSNEEIIDMLNKRFDEIDYRSAIDDVINFIDMSEYNSIRIWCSEMFKQIAEKLSSDD